MHWCVACDVWHHQTRGPIAGRVWGKFVRYQSDFDCGVPLQDTNGTGKPTDPGPDHRYRRHFDLGTARSPSPRVGSVPGLVRTPLEFVPWAGVYSTWCSKQEIWRHFWMFRWNRKAKWPWHGGKVVLTCPRFLRVTGRIPRIHCHHGTRQRQKPLLYVDNPHEFNSSNHYSVAETSKFELNSSEEFRYTDTTSVIRRLCDV